MATFEKMISELTWPLNGQYPRPWMSKLSTPLSAKVLIVGKNQAKVYTVEQVGTHERYLDALFNRNGQSNRRLYDQITDRRPSPTRMNIDSLTARLERAGVSEILETNVICYSTPLSKDLTLPIHRGGSERGAEIFNTLLHFVRPSVLITHGADAVRKLAKVLGTKLPAPPGQADEVRCKETNYGTVFVLPSLAPPAYNKWASWAPTYLDQIAIDVARLVKRP